MKCKSCAAEWSAPNSQTAKCPFCGDSLVNNSPTRPLPPEQIIKQILDDFGIDILNEKVRLSGLLSDYMPFDTKSLKLLKMAVDSNITVELYRLKDLKAKERSSLIGGLKGKFKSANFLEEYIADYGVDCFSYAMGLTVVTPKLIDPSTVKNSHTSPNNNQIKKKGGSAAGYVIAISLLILLLGGYLALPYLQEMINGEPKNIKLDEYIVELPAVDDSVEKALVKKYADEDTDTSINGEQVSAKEKSQGSDSNTTIKNTSTEKKKVVKAKSESVEPVLDNKTENGGGVSYAPVNQNKAGFVNMRYTSGESYSGYVNSRGKRHGKGTYTWRTGSKYVGDWVEDKATGSGIYYDSEGWSYEGQFVNRVFHGKGTYYFANGKKKKGVWENGKIK